MNDASRVDAPLVEIRQMSDARPGFQELRGNCFVSDPEQSQVQRRGGVVKRKRYEGLFRFTDITAWG